MATCVVIGGILLSNKGCKPISNKGNKGGGSFGASVVFTFALQAFRDTHGAAESCLRVTAEVEAYGVTAEV